MKRSMLHLIKTIKKNTIIKKLFLICFMTFGSFSNAHAEFYDYYSSSLGLSAGFSERNKTDKIIDLSLQYSQPNNFFLLPGRSNFEFFYNTANKSNLHYKNNIVYGLSQDFHFLRLNNFYSGVGVGFYIENRINDLLDSQFTFGNKFYVGYQFNNYFNTEVFLKHFPKNSLAVNNSNLNIAGISFIINFE